jgi:hypothetical protein
MSDQGEVLKEACDDALGNLDLQPCCGTTYCNVAVMGIAAQMGCQELNGLIADEIYQVMATNPSGRWTKVEGAEATLHALGGGLAIAGLPSHRLMEAHGHVAVVYPQGMEASGSLGHDVPMLANVGKTVGVMKSTAAFPVADGEAEYYIWS